MKLKNSSNKGFTLIELLIVIALLGALAVGLLASIDPFEQLKKGNDTSIRNMVSELYNASIRTYAAKGSFSWSTDLTGMAASDANFLPYITDIVNTGELKAGFAQLAGTSNLGRIFITSTSGGATRSTVSVCYLPDSKSFQKDANTKFDQIGKELQTGCASMTSSGTSCYWCVQ